MSGRSYMTAITKNSGQQEKDGKMTEIRRHIHFYGRVQGVGFRYKAKYMAQSLGLTGWVRNCSDGRVEMEVQGDAGRIEVLISRLQSDSYIRITDMEWKDLPLDEKETKFQTKFTYYG